MSIEYFWSGALRRAVIDGEVETGSVMAGQSVGMVTQVQPVAEIIRELVQQAETALVLRQNSMEIPGVIPGDDAQASAAA